MTKEEKNWEIAQLKGFELYETNEGFVLQKDGWDVIAKIFYKPLPDHFIPENIPDYVGIYERKKRIKEILES